MGGIIVGTILILIGLSALTGIPVIGFFFNFVIAVILITFGVRIIARGSARYGWQWHDHRSDSNKVVSDDERIDEVAVFSSINKSFRSGRFRGGKVVMVFSSGVIDLTDAKADSQEVHLDVSSVFSGIEIIVPKEWAVRREATPMIGSIDLYGTEGGGSAVTLVVHGEAVFGDIKIRKL